MKKRSRAAAPDAGGEEFVAEGYESVSEAPDAAENAEPEEKALARLGRALINRLRVPEGMTLTEAVDAVLSVWENGGAEGEAPVGETAGESGEPDEGPEKNNYPRPMRGTMTADTGADYESMSAEQFRRLKQQLRRASMDGRKIRL